MFTELMYIALAVCLLLCASREDHLADEMSFETLLGRNVFKFLPCLLVSLEYFLVKAVKAGGINYVISGVQGIK